MEQYLRYIINVATESAGHDLQPVYGISGEARLPERDVPSAAGLSRAWAPCASATRPTSSGRTTSMARSCSRRRSTSSTSGSSRAATSRTFERLERLGERARSPFRHAGRGPLGVSGPAARAHVLGGDVLGRLRSPCAHRDAPRRRRSREPLARDRPIACTRRSSATPGTRSSAASRRASATTTLDASLLLLPHLDFVRADDPRFASTRARDRSATLRRGHHLRRYHAADDFGAPENAFNICTFWYIDALAATGRRERGARDLREHARVPQLAGAAVRGHRSRHARAVGQLPADLQHGRDHQFGRCASAARGRKRCDPNRRRLESRRGRRDRARPPGGLAIGVLARAREGRRASGSAGTASSLKASRSDPRACAYAAASRTRRFALNKALFEQYYNGFCNNTLWPLFHYRLGFFEYDRAQFDAYFAVNDAVRAQARAVARARRHHLGARLPPDPARRRAAAARARRSRSASSCTRRCRRSRCCGRCPCTASC